MIALPKGYYAIQADFENASKDSFTFRGVTYAVQEGVNLFGTLPEAELRIAEDGEPCPDTVLEGIPYVSFDTPVLLFSFGEHRIDGYEFGGSRTLLGEGVGISPNLFDDGEFPAFNPARAGEESVFYGGYSRGVLTVRKNEVERVLIDGVTYKKARFFDYRTAGNCESLMRFRNVIYRGPSSHITHYFASPRADSGILREVRFEDCRVDHFDDMLQGGVFLYPNARRTVLDGFCCDGTSQVFGFTDIARTRSVCSPNCDVTDIEIRRSYFRDLTGDHGISVNCHNAGNRAVNLTVEDTAFINASREGEAPLHPHLVNGRCALRLRGCRFVDTRGNAAAVLVRGEGEDIAVENCTAEGFDTLLDRVVPVTKTPPRVIENHENDWTTQTADPHTVIGTARADLSALDALYEGRVACYGDQHCHTNCGGRSDGKYPMSGWVAEMDRLSLDFAAIVDHRQMRGYFLPEWDDERFIIGTEPGSKLLDPCGELKKETFHYNMLFPHKYGLAMVLANFPEFVFRGDELTGSFEYPPFTRERIRALNDYIRSIGGVLVHAHPMSLLGSDDPLDYYFGEYSHLEVMVAAYHGHRSFKSYDLWLKILDSGKHMYAAGGSDTHGNVTNGCVSTLYSEEKNGAAYLRRIYAGDYTAGAVGIKMSIDGVPMGGVTSYRDGMTLSLRVGDFFAPAHKPETAYELRIYSDRGLCYAATFDGSEPQELSLAVQDRRFYRAEIFDLTHGCRVAVGNPIWLDAEAQA